MNEYITEFEWNDNLRALAAYGKSLIDPATTEASYKDRFENHLVVFNREESDPPEGITLPLKLDRLLLSCLRANSVGKIHKDGLNRNCALNIPVSNTEIGNMQWFSDEFKINVEQYSKTVVRSIEEDEFSTTVPVAYEQTILKPSLVNTNIWHRIDNSQNTEDRYILTLRFNGNPSYKIMKTLLTSWLRTK